MKRNKAIAVQSVRLVSTFTVGNKEVTTYEAEVLVRTVYFKVSFYVERVADQISFGCNKAHLELFGVMIAYFGRQLTSKQDRNKKHNCFTAKLSQTIADHINLKGVNDYDKMC